MYVCMHMYVCPPPHSLLNVSKCMSAGIGLERGEQSDPINFIFLIYIISYCRTMLEPGVRYLPHVPLQATLPSHISLEAAVDLSKKSEDWGSRSTMEIDDHDDSDSDTPLDMSVTASRLTPVFPGFSRDLSPARSDRSDQFVRSHGFYSPVPHARDWSTERSEADKGTSIILKLIYFYIFSL